MVCCLSIESEQPEPVLLVGVGVGVVEGVACRSPTLRSSMLGLRARGPSSGVEEASEHQTEVDVDSRRSLSLHRPTIQPHFFHSDLPATQTGSSPSAPWRPMQRRRRPPPRAFV